MAWPTTSNPKTEFVTLRFDAQEMADVDAAASTAGMSRSAYLRDCYRRVKAAEKRKVARLKAGEQG